MLDVFSVAEEEEVARNYRLAARKSIQKGRNHAESINSEKGRREVARAGATPRRTNKKPRSFDRGDVVRQACYFLGFLSLSPSRPCFDVS